MLPATGHRRELDADWRKRGGWAAGPRFARERARPDTSCFGRKAMPSQEPTVTGPERGSEKGVTMFFWCFAQTCAQHTTLIACFTPIRQPPSNCHGVTWVEYDNNNSNNNSSNNSSNNSNHNNYNDNSNTNNNNDNIVLPMVTMSQPAVRTLTYIRDKDLYTTTNKCLQYLINIMYTVF